MGTTAKQKADRLRKTANVLELEAEAESAARKAAAATDPAKRARLSADALEAADRAKKARRALSRRRPAKTGPAKMGLTGLPASVAKLLR